MAARIQQFEDDEAMARELQESLDALYVAEDAGPPPAEGGDGDVGGGAWGALGESDSSDSD